MFRKAIVNWKTTVGGIIAAVAVILNEVNLFFDNDAATNPDWNIVVAAVAAIWVALNIRDADKSSQDNEIR